MTKKKFAALGLTMALLFSLLPSNPVLAYPEETIIPIEEEVILEDGSQDANNSLSDSEDDNQETPHTESIPTDEESQQEFSENITIESETEEVVTPTMNAETNQISLLTPEEGEPRRTLILSNPEKDYSDMRVAVWSAENGQDDKKWYTLTKQKDGSWKADIDLTLLKHSGKTYFHIYTGSSTFIGDLKENFSEDDITKYPYTITENGDSRTVTINTSVRHTDMRMAVWSEENGQDDLTWYDLTKQDDGSWKGDFSVSDLKHDGKINIQLYTGYTSEEKCLREFTLTIIKEELKAKEITLSTSGAKRSLRVTTTSASCTGVKVAVWSATNGQDDLKWYKLTQSESNSAEWKTSIYLMNLKHSGTVNLHVYTDKNEFLGSKTITITTAALNGLDLKVTSKDYNTTLTMTPAKTFSNITAAVWSKENGQDDLIWYTMTEQADGSWKTSLANSSLKHSGTIIVHFYSGSIFLGEKRFELKEEDIPQNSVQVTGSNSSRTITVTTPKTISSMQVAVWSATNGQDDLKWYELKQSTGNSAEWKTSIPLMNLKHSGTVYLHVYTDKNVFLDSKTITITAEELNGLDLKVTSKDYITTLVMTPAKAYSNISAAVWSNENGQDDLKWYSMTEQADGSWKTTLANSSLKHSGTIIVHFYSGSNFLGAKEFELKEDDIPKNSVQITGSNGSRTITVNTSKTISNMRVAVWSKAEGQDDLRWYTMTQKSSNVWSVTIKTSDLLHSGICNAHVYTDASTNLGAETFTVAESEIPKHVLTITGSGSGRVIRMSNPAASYTSVTVAVWSATSSQDDLEWLAMKKDSNGSWVISYPISKLSHSGKCYAHVYANNTTLLATGSFQVSDADYFKGLLTYGNDSNIDFVQCAINIARNNDIGYGHTWPATISCAGLVGLSLTYCGYGDFIQNDPKGWGYIDLGPEYVQELRRIGCTMLMGPWYKNNITQLQPGDILYTYVDDSRNHVGIYLGNGLTVEARGPSGANDTDSNGREISIYDITSEPTSFQVAYRLNSLHTSRNT